MRVPIVVLLLTASGCILPQKVSPDCKKQISDCMAACPSRQSTGEDNGVTGDERTACEQRCHDSCR